jgi:hypothetical protein
MKLSLLAALSASLVTLVGCAHNPPPTAVSRLTTTSADVPRTPPPLDLFETPAEEAAHPTPYNPVDLPPVDRWASRYPDAATELGQWELANPETARSLARWQERHPEQMEALIEWSSDHGSEPLGAFLMDRAGWSDLQAIAGESEDLHGFLAWVGNAPRAAREMAQHTDGLAFADEHAALFAKASEAAAIRRTRGGAEAAIEFTPIVPPSVAAKQAGRTRAGSSEGPSGPVD